jgi:hypothetical protein
VILELAAKLERQGGCEPAEVSRPASDRYISQTPSRLQESRVFTMDPAVPRVIDGAEVPGFSNNLFGMTSHDGGRSPSSKATR